MARDDPDRIREVMDWPLRDLFLVYVECMKDLAHKAYDIELLVWSSLAPHLKNKKDPPAMPAVLRS